MSKKLKTVVGVVGGVLVALVVAAVGFVLFQPKPRRLVAKYC
jgi:CDP-diglyceride synthetase